MSSGNDRLSNYQKKRDFTKTNEPRGQDTTFDWTKKRPIFVIQKHDASSLHYDFRLEINGVLKSWAVPKGPSTDPREKRLAIPTEDHPLDYANFEGVIAEGQYGSGTVLIWDRGSYCNLKQAKEDSEDATGISEQFENGHLTVWLEGDKLKGGYALIRTDVNDENRWLLVKMDDDEADARRNPISTEPHSVASGRTLEDVRADEVEE